MFRTMGHLKIAVLDGGLPAWINAGLPTIEAPVAAPKIGNFQSAPIPDRILSYGQMVANSENPDFLVVDARSRGRFLGSDPEPRARLKSGHIPHSVCIPYQSLISDGFLKKPTDLHPIFEEATGGRTDLVFSCGSGLTACIVLLASEVAYASSPRVYDGSWTEWAELQGLTYL
jgi:thiosulfate/3-mercaptopyruvate sulfurtransferase